MDEQVRQLMEKYGVTEEQLRNNTVTIQFDINGRKDVQEYISSLRLGFKKSEETQLTGGQLIDICGNAYDVLSLVGMVIGSYGNSAEIGLNIPAIGCVVGMTAIKVMEQIIKNSKIN